MKKLILSLIIFNFSLCSAQSWDWGELVKNTDSIAGGEGWGLARDKSSNLYFTGEFHFNLIAGNDTLTTVNYGSATNTYLIKYDSNGNALWGRQSVCSSPYYPFVEGTGVVVDKAGNVLMTGDFHDSTYFGSNLISTNSNVNGVFITKYDQNGNVLWVRQSGGVYHQGGFAESIATDGNDNIYITGSYFDIIAFGPYILNGSGGFIAKYDSAGNVQWAKTIGKSGSTIPYAITADASGNTYLTGTFSDTIIAGRDTVVSSQAGFIAKYNTAGDGIWVVKGAHRGYSVALDNAGNVYSTGYYFGSEVVGTDTLPGNNLWNNLYFDKYDTAGNFEWVKYAMNKNRGDCMGFTICCDSKCHIYLYAGVITEGDTLDVSFDSLHFVNNNTNSPIILVKYDSSGKALCGSLATDGGDDQSGLVAEPSGNGVYLGADFVEMVIFGPDTLKELPGAGEVQGIAKWKPCNADITNVKSINNTTPELVGYPNPSSGIFTFQSSVVRGKCSVEIYNVLGEKVYSQFTIHNSPFTINLSDKANGIYFYRVTKEDGSLIGEGKIIVQH